MDTAELEGNLNIRKDMPTVRSVATVTHLHSLHCRIFGVNTGTTPTRMHGYSGPWGRPTSDPALKMIAQRENLALGFFPLEEQGDRRQLSPRLRAGEVFDT